MLVATWNVNSLRVRLPHLKDWLAANPVDVLALQETKLDDANFPREEIEALGLQVAYSGQRTYNGVALSPGPRWPTSCPASRALPTSRNACLPPRSAACG